MKMSSICLLFCWHGVLAKCHALQTYRQRSGSPTQRDQWGPDSIGTEETARLCSNRNVLILMGSVNVVIIQSLQTQIKKERGMTDSLRRWCSKMWLYCNCNHDHRAADQQLQVEEVCSNRTVAIGLEPVFADSGWRRPGQVTGSSQGWHKKIYNIFNYLSIIFYMY